MISLPHFAKTNQHTSANKIDRTVGADGYRACDRATVCKFQQIVERESDCDYEALRAALAAARVIDGTGRTAFVVNLVNLRRVYNDAVYAGAQYAYASR